MKKHEALAAMEREELLADHLPTTRQTYQRIVAEFCDLLTVRKVDGFQGYLDHLAAGKKVSSKTVRQALNALMYGCGLRVSEMVQLRLWECDSKAGRAVFGRLAWYWLFPSRVVRGDERWHATPHGVAKTLQIAAEAAAIIKRISPHVWRADTISPIKPNPATTKNI